MKYTNKENVYLTVKGHPEGITLSNLTRELFPDIGGTQFRSAKRWVSSVLSEFRRKGRVYNTGEEGLPRIMLTWFATEGGSDEDQS